MARRATSLSSSLCILTAALLAFAATFVLATTHQARADAGVKKSGVCNYDSPDGRAAFKKRDYRQAIELLTKGIEWIEQNCKGWGWSYTGLWKNYKFRAAAYTYLKEYDKAVHDLAVMNDQVLQEWSPGEEKWVFEAYDGAVKRKPNSPFLRGARAAAYQTWAHVVGFEDKKLQTNYFKTALADRDAQLKLVKTKTERAEVLADRADLYFAGWSGSFGPDAPQHALEDISAAIGLDPKAGYYAQRSFLQKDPKLAFEDISKAIELSAETGSYYKRRSEIRGRLKQPTEAVLEDLSAAIAKTSPDDSNYADYVRARADLLVKDGKLDEAEKDYAALLKADPKSLYSRREHLLLLMKLGRDKDAEVERKAITRLDRMGLLNSGFMCRVADIDAARAGENKPATPKDQRTAWKLGELVALVPLQYLVGKPNEKTNKTWAIVSDLVKAQEKDAGKPARGLDPIPTFKGSKTAQVRQTIAFFFKQRKKVSTALADKVGGQAAADFDVSSAGYMALGLNRMGVPNLNHQLGEMLQKEGPLTGLPCYVWVHTALKTQSRAKPDEVVKAWEKGSKDAEEYWAKEEKPKPDKGPAP